MNSNVFTRFAVLGLGFVALLLAAGCGGSGSTTPDGPPGPNLSTPNGTMGALEDFYSLRQAEAALALFAVDYTFHPTRPENIEFLAVGETSWDLLQEVAILELLLVPERSTWIDQVLLEVHKREQRDLGFGRVEFVARVELSVLIGVDEFRKAESEITYVLEVDAEGNYHLVEEFESPSILSGELSVGELRAQSLEDRS